MTTFCGKIGLALVLQLGVLAGSTSFAAQSLENVPVRLFEGRGIMNYIDLPGSTVSIDGKRYRLASAIKWYGLPEGDKSLARKLYGMVDVPVGYIPDADKKVPTIKALWLMYTGERN